MRVEVSEFAASQTPFFFRGSDQGSDGRNWGVAIGLACTICLHALVIQLLGVGFGTHAALQSERQGAFADQANSSVAPAEELILIAVDDAPRNKFDIAQQIASLAPKLKAPPISIISPDHLQITDLGDPDGTSDDRPAKSEVDPATRALMLNRYLGQISARVEGAWVQPAESATDWSPNAGRKGAFKCRVQIRQDAVGKVQEVLLLECDGAQAWRQSLVTAIYQASPLNAPPIPSVFSRALTMTFEAPSRNRGTPDGPLSGQ